MRVITKRKLREFWEQHSQSQVGLILWYERINKTNFQSFQELRNIFRTADLVGNFIVFNICGNNYRLITYIDFKDKLVFIRAVLTHSEYDKENWKNDNWFKKF